MEPAVLGLLVVQGCGVAVAGPAAAALVPKIAGEDAATQGYAWLATGRTVGLLAGSAGGALLIAAVGTRGALVVDSLTTGSLQACWVIGMLAGARVITANLLGTVASAGVVALLGPRWTFAVGGIGALVIGLVTLGMLRTAKSPDVESGLVAKQ